MKLTAITTLVCCLLAPLTSMGADKEGSFAVKGAGLASCERYVAERMERSPVYYMFGGWLEGYLTAINQIAPDTYDIAAWQATDLLAAIIDNHCRQNPDHNFFVVVNALTTRLMQERLQTKSPQIEVKAGDQGIILYQETLRRLQQALKDRGHYTGSVDGLFGPQTRAALEAFQRHQNLEVTGLPDQLTLLRLFDNFHPEDGSD